MWLYDLRTWLIVYEISQWTVRLVMLMVVPLRRSPQSAGAWLLLILFFPWIGLGLYLLIGRYKLPPWRQQKRHEFALKMQAVVSRLEQSTNVVSPPLAAEQLPAVALAQSLGSFRILDGNHLELLPDYLPTLNRLVADIEAAQHHVHLLFYIFAVDKTTARVLEALRHAAGRGVQCRVLADAFGSQPFVKKLRRELAAAGVEVREALPLGLRRVKATRFDLRNHRKIAVIDGQVAYTGSQNVVDPGFKRGIVYEDLMVRASGPIVDQLQFIFLADWYVETGLLLHEAAYFPPRGEHGELAAQVLPSGPSYENANNEFLILSLLYAAKRRVVITTPYFIPDESLLQALKIAVQRGVEVRLVLSAVIDQFLVGFAQESYYEELLEAGVHVFRYQPKLLHSKHLTFDDNLALIGSSNVDQRSFRLNEEVSLLCYDAAFSAQLHQEQARYFAHSEQLTAEAWRNRSRARRLLQNMARLVSPLL